jgi:hypothetical protein
MKMERVIYRRVFAEIIITCRAFYKGKGDLKKARILSFGVNQMIQSNGFTPSIHAECDAISKLIPLKPKKHLEQINILVIRLSIKNKIQSSKPCSNCIETMVKMPPKKGYKIQNVFYSDGFGNIVKTSLASLEKEERHYSKFYRNRHRFQMT